MPLVVIEGIDGSGTTLQVDKLATRFSKEREIVWNASSPSTGPFGRLVRSVFEGRFPEVPELPNWRTMLCLFQADLEHRQLFMRDVKDDLFILDRYWLSSMTYQVAQAMAEGTSKEEASELIMKMNERSIVPAATIILDVSVEEGLRRKNKSPDFFEKQEFLEKVRQLYLEVRGENVKHVSTENKTPQEVHEEIYGLLSEMGI